MATTSLRKAAVGTLALALIALVLDRTVFKEGSPLSPQTAQAALAPRDGATVVGHGAQAPKAAAPSAVVAEHLRGVRDRMGIVAGPDSDAFDPTRLFKSTAPDGNQAAGSTARDRFIQAHQLTSVLLSADGSRALAIVDGKLLNVDDTVDNDKIRRRLLSISSSSAVFDVDGEHAALVMQLPSQDDFARHKLNAVLFTSDGKRVGIIDGRLQVHIGDVLDGYRVVSIDPGDKKGVPSVVFEAEGKRVTLWVP